MASQPLFHRLCAALRLSLAEMARTPAYLIVAAIFLVYSVISSIILHSKGIEVTWIAYFEGALVPLTIGVFVLLAVGWPETMRRRLLRFFRQELIVSGLVLLLMGQIFHSVFLIFKMSFTKFKAFHADAQMMELDRTLHFGKLPWEWLEPVFGNAAAIGFIDICYTLWLAFDVIFLAWMCFVTKKDDVRAVFFLTYFMTWAVLGTVCAFYWLSAGPCYFHHVSTLPNPYAPQMDFLQALDTPLPLAALGFQKVLWDNHVGQIDGLVNGISAFPSTHVAIALIFFLAALQYSRKAAIFFGLFFAIIVIGSVALGWHYAVDSYFSIIVTAVIWYGNLSLTRRFGLWQARKALKEKL